jgi:hypothetical protein
MLPKAVSTTLQHPLIQAKKYEGRTDAWQWWINADYHFYFLINRDTYLIIDIAKHPK